MKEQNESQVREIIDQLNEEHPSKERSREVVVRKDGSKVVRVQKKRRVTISEQDKNRRSRKKYILLFLAFFALLIFSAAFIGLKVSMMGGTQYLNDRKDEIRVAFQAESIEMEGAKIEGLNVHIAKLVLRYPASSQVERVELESVGGSFDVLGVVHNKMMFESLNISKATLVMREGATQIQAPATVLSGICSFTRVDCKAFNLYIGDYLTSPVSVYDTNAYLYYPDHDKDKIVFSCRGGQFVVKDWLEFDIKDLRAAFLEGGKIDLSADLTMLLENTKEEGKKERRLEMRKQLHEGENFYGPYTFICSNIPIADLTKARLLPFFSATTKMMSAKEEDENHSTITFSDKAETPTIKADLAVGNVSWYHLPALQEIQKHVESSKRSLYAKLLIPYGRIHLDSSPEGISLSFKETEMSEPYSVVLVGSLHVAADGALTGSLEYGVPASLTRREYSDGLSDPIFNEEGSLAWLRTDVSGTNVMPEDNSLDLHLAAEEARQSRPKPNRLDVMNIDVFADQMGTTRPQGTEEKADGDK
ncbi:MAG: hypothetical protein R3Y56_01345 [Akkermansia sp.]